jgi:hypothetical protein
MDSIAVKENHMVGADVFEGVPDGYDKIELADAFDGDNVGIEAKEGMESVE